MAERRVAVLGGGNTGFSLAANLQLRGFAVTLWEIPAHAGTLAPLHDGAIRLTGVAEQGMARLHHVTTDIGEALAANDLVLVPVPSYAHRAFAAACVPHLRPGHVIVLTPGNMGALAFAEAARTAGTADGVIFAEADTAPYVCRKLGPDHAHIWGVVSGIGVAAFPARGNDRLLELLADVFPGVRAYPHIVACGLSAGNPILHPAGVLLNAGRVEYARGDFYFYEEGVTPGVVRAIKAVDAERLAIGARLGLTLDPVEETYWQAGFGPHGDLWATINGSRMLTQLRAPGSLDTRWLTEDIPYGIATWSALGTQFDVPTPVMSALTDLGAAVTGQDLRAATRTPADLGIAHLDRDPLTHYLTTGETN
ncbi:MAG: NAD/NADP octopine/nopaline dehydrogenase family protein [Thermomicrobiales bacterium]